MKYHSDMRPMDPPGTPGRRWMCRACGVEDVLVDRMQAKLPCQAPDKPSCVWCGQTPECAADCEGVAIALAFAADVIDMRKPPPA